MKIDHIKGSGSFYASTSDGLEKCQWGFYVEIDYEIKLEEIKPLIEQIEPFMEKHHLYKVVIERQFKWSREKQKRLDEYQYQAFTNKNQSCAPPAPSVMEALEAAVEYFK